MQKRTLTTIDPSKLIKHPLSLRIYGEQSDPGFDESIKARGIDEPIVVAADGKTIISGVRRRNGAIKAGIKKVPIIVREDLVNDIDIREAIIEANRHNEQTNEAKAAAYSELKEIEKERAAMRRNATLKQNKKPSVEDVLHTDEGRAADKAAKQVGLSSKTAEKAVAVVEKIKEATDAGKVTTAEDLRQTLNKSVSKAHEVSVHSEAYTTAFNKLLSGIQKQIRAKPSIASEACVIAMSKLDVSEQSKLSDMVRKGINNVTRFDQLVTIPKKQGGKRTAENLAAKSDDKPKAPAKPAPKQTAKQFADALIKDHIRPLAKGLDQLAKLTGEKGKDHVAGVSALDRVLTIVTKMGAK